MAQHRRIGTKTHKQGRREATPRTGGGLFPPHPSISSSPPHKLHQNPQVTFRGSVTAPGSLNKKGSAAPANYSYGLGTKEKAPVPPRRLGRILKAVRRCRKTAVPPAENFRLGRELQAHNANRIVPDEVVLAWRRDYLNGKTAQEWVMYAKELNDPICPICGNAHTGDSCVVDPGV